jgi:phospholipid/cholesterol/gamma-HCH transport system substrate-binding protein
MALFRRRRAPDDPADRVLRKDRTGMSAVKVGLIAAVIVAIGVYFGFAKDIPFTEGYRLRAVFESSNQIRLNSPVRIAGVNVGKVKSIDRQADTGAAIVVMEIQEKGLPIHKDAEAKIRPRIFLEGNFFVDLKPGTPAAPTLEDGDTLPITQTATPVQFDQILNILQQDTRTSLRDTLQGLGDGLVRKPSAADDTDGDRTTRGQSAAQSLNDAIDYGEEALRGTALVSDALAGAQRDDVSALLRGLSRTTEGLGRNERQLQGLITNFNRTLAATAAESGNLQASIRELGPTLQSADGALDALNGAFPNTRAFAREILPGVRETPATVAATFPWIEEARPLLGKAELGGLVSDLRPGTASLARVATQSLSLMREADLLSRCTTENLLPTLESRIDDGDLSSGTTVSKEFWHAMVGIATEGQNFDGNGHYVRLHPGGGNQQLELGGRRDPYYGSLPGRPLGTRPAWPATKPPIRPTVACHTQQKPNLTARTGPSDAQGATATAATASARGGGRP